jgi:hypothetical protein
VYRWELDRGDQSIAIALNGSLILDDLELVIQAAIDGAGLAWVAEDRVARHLASGALVRVLEDWCPPFAGFFLYYPSRKQQPVLSENSIRLYKRLGTGTTRPWTAPHDVALFLPFGHNKPRQGAAKTGTTRKREVARFFGHECTVWQRAARPRKARLTASIPPVNRRVAGSSPA